MKILLVLLAMPWTTMLRGFVLVKLWHWFITPLGVIELRVPIALGIALTVSLLTTDFDATREKREWWGHLVISTSVSLIALGFGWLYTLFL